MPSHHRRSLSLRCDKAGPHSDWSLARSRPDGCRVAVLSVHANWDEPNFIPVKFYTCQKLSGSRLTRSRTHGIVTIVDNLLWNCA